jgi:hypothetical protein
MVSSINFALMSEDEQNAVIGNYQNFLNSLDFPLEVVIQSRKLNITSYLDKLKDLETRQSNDLLRTQIIEYRNFYPRDRRRRFDHEQIVFMWSSRSSRR